MPGPVVEDGKRIKITEIFADRFRGYIDEGEEFLVEEIYHHDTGLKLILKPECGPSFGMSYEACRWIAVD